MNSPTLEERAAGIKLLILDIDGVLTDGRVIYDQEGRELKFFDIKDGHGLKLLQRAGFGIVWLSGRQSQVNRVRARELGIDELVEDCKVKLPVFEKLVAQRGLKPEQAAFMGDDLIDLPPMRACGLALAPADAWPEVRAMAHWVASLPGGRGAVRQACELLLKASGKWEEVTGRYF
jgi:3-deoxy-D-manno-octulosonate 8-phosphate phosphatase (KDO 8-P phosphatase)